MQSLKVKTTTGKTVDVNRDELVTAAVELMEDTFSQNHGVIIWGGKTTGRWAIVPYNLKNHSDEN